jgi:hypothetical protein
MKQATPWSTGSSRGYAIAYAYLQHRRVFPHVPASMALAYVRMVTR